MGSRVIGFRVPDDLAEELERVSDERGQTTAEFLRKLVDDALYPSKGEGKTTLGSSADDGEVTLSDVSGEVELHEENIEEINNKIVKIDGNIGTLTQDVNRRFEVTFHETAKLANDYQLLDDKCKQLEKFINRTVEDCKKLFSNYETKLAKLHICPDCGRPLHLHKVGDFVITTSKAMETSYITQGNSWHLECLHCGYCSVNYQYPEWKDQKALFATQKEVKG